MNGQPTAEGSQAIRTLFQKQMQGNGMKQATHTIDESRTAGTPTRSSARPASRAATTTVSCSCSPRTARSGRSRSS
ncbi:hypothetical protein ACFQ0B_28040 [Nonomuraea thailandensis]